MPVIPKKGGPWSLFCTDCGVWTPNTANAEMQKEGFYASSHVCGHIRDGEVRDEEYWGRINQVPARWEIAKDGWPCCPICYTRAPIDVYEYRRLGVVKAAETNYCPHCGRRLQDGGPVA